MESFCLQFVHYVDSIYKIKNHMKMKQLLLLFLTNHYWLKTGTSIT